jgi:DNA-directed RNA polymerase specialized sigma24 family protein
MSFLHKGKGCIRATNQAAGADEIANAFNGYREELEWLALFLMGDKELAEACLVDARSLATIENQVFEEWLEHWARRATIRSAADMQQSRITQLASAYERNPCPHKEHKPLDAETVELLKTESSMLAFRLDALCRFALILRGVEGYSARESALVLGVSRIAVEAAYCAALEFLKFQSCELIAQLDSGMAES